MVSTPDSRVQISIEATFPTPSASYVDLGVSAHSLEKIIITSALPFLLKSWPGMLLVLNKILFMRLLTLNQSLNCISFQ